MCVEVVDGSNIDVACELALKMGDVRSLFDAVEGALDLGLIPPYIQYCQMRPKIREAMEAMTDKLKSSHFPSRYIR